MVSDDIRYLHCYRISHSIILVSDTIDIYWYPLVSDIFGYFLSTIDIG